MCEFKRANERLYEAIESGTTLNQKWSMPTMDFVKVNLDAAVDKDHMKMGIGGDYKRSWGEVLLTLIAPKQHTIDLVALRVRVVIFAKELGFQKIEVEGNAL